MVVQREIGDEALQPTIFFLQLPEAPQCAHAQMGVLFLPHINRGFRHTPLPTDPAHRGAGVTLAKGIDDLVFREF